MGGVTALGAKLRERVHKKLREMRNAWRDYPLRDGRVIGGRYRIVRHIGMGSYGLAYEGADMQSGRRVLLKANKPSKGQLGCHLLRRERDILQRLSHPHIPAWMDWFSSGKQEWLVMELMEGRNLEDAVMDAGAVLHEREVLAIARKLLNPLQHLHAAGFVHRDVRIPNVLIHGDNIHLIDYGLACGIGEVLPEELRQGLGELRPDDDWDSVKRRMRDPAVSSDLYGLGHLMLFLLYAGYEGLDGAQDDTEERSWQEELAISEAMKELIAKLLANGFGSAEELGDAIDRMLNQQA